MRNKNSFIESVAKIIDSRIHFRRKMRRITAIIGIPLIVLLVVMKSNDLLTAFMATMVGIVFIIYNIVMFKKEKYNPDSIENEVDYYNIED